MYGTPDKNVAHQYCPMQKKFFITFSSTSYCEILMLKNYIKLKNLRTEDLSEVNFFKMGPCRFRICTRVSLLIQNLIQIYKINKFSKKNFLKIFFKRSTDLSHISFVDIYELQLKKNTI